MVERIRANGNGHDKSGPPPRISPNPRKRMKFSPELMAVISQRTPPAVPRRPYELPKPPPGVVPKGVKPQMAMDDIGLGGLGTWAGNNAFAWSAQNNYQSAYAEGLAFPGYAYLSELAQRPEYRRLSEIFATEMTRKWIELESVGNIDKTERIKELKDALDHYGVRDHFHECIALDGQFGRSHIYIDTGDRDDREELKIPLGNGRNDISKKKVSPDRPIKYLKAIEPIWTYPANYESIDPLSPDWYEPNSWFVNGKEIHKSRLLKFVSRPVPDILKPAYAFGGLSMSQMAIPYINNWLNMRQNIANTVQAFSVFNLATDLSELITQDGDQLLQRAQFFNYFRNNQGLLLTNKDTEDFSNVSAPLGTLDQLLAQSQEFICSISGIPLVKYTGLSPHGLNASSEGEIRSFYDWIHACQEKQIRPNLTTIIDFIMLSKWGEVDHEITYRFNPLWELDEAALATMRKTDADTGAVLVESGIISQEEERKRVAADPGSPYASIEVEDMPELRKEEEEGLEPHTGAAKLAEGAGEQEGEIDVPNRGTSGGMPGQEGEGGDEPLIGSTEGQDKEPYETGELRSKYIEGENPIAEAAAMRDMIPDSPDRGSPENRWLAEKAIERRKMGLKGNNPLEGAESLGGSDILKNSTRLQNSDRLKNSTRLQGHELDQSGRYLKDRRLQKESSADPFGGGGVGNDRFTWESGDLVPIAEDWAFDAGEWEESKHSRGQPENAGQFGPGGGSSSAKSEQKKSSIKQDIYQIEKMLNDTAKKPDANEINAMRIYTVGRNSENIKGAYAINKALRKKAGPIKKDTIEGVLQDYLTSSEIPEEITVHRVLNGDFAKELKQSLKPGMGFSDQAFMSSTLDPNLRAGSELEFEITVPKGSKGAPVDKYRPTAPENEIVFAAGSSLRIMSIENNKVKAELVQDNLRPTAEGKQQAPLDTSQIGKSLEKGSVVETRDGPGTIVKMEEDPRVGRIFTIKLESGRRVKEQEYSLRSANKKLPGNKEFYQQVAEQKAASYKDNPNVPEKWKNAEHWLPRGDSAFDAMEPLIGPSRRADAAFDAEFEESKHPRGQPANAGQFGPGGGGGAEKSEQPKQEKPEAKPLQEASVTNGPLFASQQAALKNGITKLTQRAKEIENDPANSKTADAIDFILSTAGLENRLKLSQKANYNFNYAFGGEDGKQLVGAITSERGARPGTAEIKYLGSLQGGVGIKLLKQAEQSAKQKWKANKISLIGNEKNASFYARHGYKPVGRDVEGELHFEKDLNAAHDSAFDALAFDSIAVDFNWPEATKIAVSNALQTFAGHIAQANEPHIYDTIDHIVMNFADYAHIAKSQAKSLLQDAIHSRLSKLHAHDAEFKESDHPREDDGKFTSGGGSSGVLPHPDKMKKVGKQLGSNPGGKYEDSEGNKYYIKKGKTPEHAKNELLAGKLYNLAGVQTQKYKDVEGGGWIATEWQHFDKDNAKDFTPEEIKEAQKDFAVHAWLANWDAAGLDYDNQAIIGGKPASIDLGGALLYRAQGAPKGNAFGDKVGEWDTLRDSKINYQNAKLFASMTPEQLKQSAKKVISIPDAKIREAVKNGGMPDELATKLIARKNDIAKRAGTATAAKPEIDVATPKNISGKDNTVSFHKDMKDAPKSLHGVKFESWHPPDDWEDVEGQMDLDEDPIDADEDTRVSSGLIMQEPDGRVWLVKPSYQYGGYKQTWPKGGQEEGLSLQANAIKETFEETGLKGRITGFAGDFEGDTGITRFYHARREGGTPLDHDKETELVILASHDKLTSLLNRSRDRKIAETLKSKGAHDKSSEFHEEDHPRDPDGKFGSGSGTKSYEKTESGKDKHQQTKFVDGKRVQANGEALPEHIQKLKIPPAWTDVTYSSDPSAALLVSGKDSKGRNQSIYSDEHHMKAGAEKFARIKELKEKFDSMMKENDEAIKSADQKRKDAAECLALIASLGIRPGSEADTGGASRAYGATTLQGRHVVRTDAGNVYLRFIGKKGVKLSLKVTDPKIVEMLERRSKEAGEKGKLFPHVSDKSLLDHVHSLDGGGFKTKDFRTYIGTKTAMELVEAVKKQPADMKSYKACVREVAKAVADKLGNTPSVALSAYINPTVFAQWQEKIAA